MFGSRAFEELAFECFGALYRAVIDDLSHDEGMLFDYRQLRCGWLPNQNPGEKTAVMEYRGVTVLSVLHQPLRKRLEVDYLRRGRLH